MHNRDSRKHIIPPDYQWISEQFFLKKVRRIYYKKINGAVHWYSQLYQKWLLDS